jgi:hypothetical protein
MVTIRNVTIKQEIRSTKSAADSDRKNPIQSQLDLALRNLSGTKLDQSGNYWNVNHTMPWKPQKYEVASEDEMKARVEQFSDKSLQLLVQMLFLKLDMASMGCTSATDMASKKSNKKMGRELLQRLVPHKLQIFMVTLAEVGSSTPDQKLRQLTSMVTGSSELLRHCLHCDTNRSMKELFKVL